MLMKCLFEAFCQERGYISNEKIILIDEDILRINERLEFSVLSKTKLILIDETDIHFLAGFRFPRSFRSSRPRTAARAAAKISPASKNSPKTSSTLRLKLGTNFI